LASLPGEKAHEQSTHDGKVIGHVKLIAFAKILDYFLPPQVGFGKQQRIRLMVVDVFT